MGATARWFRTLIGIKKTKISDAEPDGTLVQRSSINSKSKRWLLWRLGSSRAKKDQLEKSQSMRLSESSRFLHSKDFDRSRRHQEGLRMQWAAIRIQCAFRRFLAQRALKALKAIVRIQAIVRGRLVRQKAYRNHHFLIDAHLIDYKRREWCDHQGSLQDLKARRQHKSDAAARRERAMTYAVLHQTAKRAEFWQNWQKEQVESQKLEGQKLRVMPDMDMSYYYSGPIFPILATSSSPSVSSCAHEHRNIVHACYCGSKENDRGYVSPSLMRPGYMEDTISMKAKCKPNLANSRKQPENAYRYRRRQHRHSSMAGLETHNYLLQCR